jgi:putative heme-binding domain-containing protein
MFHTVLIRLSALLCVAAPLAAAAQTGANPFEADAAAARAGSVMYATRCADCHGADAKGARGPDLTLLWANGVADARIFATVRSGIEGSIMVPSFAPDEEIWAVLAYLKSISTVPGFDIEGGDAQRGREVFASECADCHRVDGAGGSLGPDLTRIAEVRSLDGLVEAIRQPSAAVALGYRAVRLDTGSGRPVRGAVKSEDAFSIQIVDTEQRLQGYIKADLKTVVREEESLMPQFDRRRLSARELDDVLTYLGSLREGSL